MSRIAAECDVICCHDLFLVTSWASCCIFRACAVQPVHLHAGWFWPFAYLNAFVGTDQLCAGALLQVSSEADTLLRKKCGMDLPTPAVDMEKPALVKKMLRLIMGSPELLQANARTAASAAQRRTWQQPASHTLQMRLLRTLCTSTAACNMMPLTLQARICASGALLVCICSSCAYSLDSPTMTPASTQSSQGSAAMRLVTQKRVAEQSTSMCGKHVNQAAPPHTARVQVIMFGLREQSPARIKQGTMEFVVWVLRHASDDSMAAMAPLAFRAVIDLMGSMDPYDSASGSVQLREYLYQASGQLAQVLTPHDILRTGLMLCTSASLLCGAHHIAE